MTARVRGALLAATLAVSACDAPKPKAKATATPATDAPAGAVVQAPPSVYTSLTGHFEYAVPGAWSARVRIVEEPGVSASGTWPGVRHVVHFAFQPTASALKSQSLLTVLVYDAAKLGQKPVPAGVEIARANGRVYAGIIASKNPYPAGADHDTFASLTPTLDAVKGAIAPR